MKITTKEQIIEYFSKLSHEVKGLEGWLGKNIRDEVVDRLLEIENAPLTKVQLNQLLLLSLEAGISDDFFAYYWLESPDHPYLIEQIDDFDKDFVELESINSLKHLRWGLKRIYIDCLLYFGNINLGFKELKNKTKEQLIDFYNSKKVPTEIIRKRGAPLNFTHINKDDRYLISEMACKTYDAPPEKSDLKRFLVESYKQAKEAGHSQVSVKDLFNKDYTETSRKKYTNVGMLMFSADELSDEIITREEDIDEKFDRISAKFIKSRDAALKNTDLYLSLVNDLDVYVATSMRSRKDFREMADNCEKIFQNEKLDGLHLRYFDPTLSAAEGHEDKGLIECLMVKCAKVLVYCAGDRESYGKDAEAAMALSLGKPVIFFCNPETRADFYKSVHPLSRLIDFNSGVAVGAMVTEKLDEVSELLLRIFENKMEYYFEQPKPGYFRLKEKLTGSIVRLQTNFELLSKSFWTYYHTRHEIT